jgi:hypothetical protein
MISWMRPGASRRLLYDFSVYDDRGRLAAVVEAKRRFDTDETWARDGTTQAGWM